MEIHAMKCSCQRKQNKIQPYFNKIFYMTINYRKFRGKRNMSSDIMGVCNQVNSRMRRTLKEK